MIKIFLKFKVKLKIKDERSLNVLYYCLELNNDDKICVRYLEIIFKGFIIGKFS